MARMSIIDKNGSVGGYWQCALIVERSGCFNIDYCVDAFFVRAVDENNCCVSSRDVGSSRSISSRRTGGGDGDIRRKSILV